VLAHPAGMNISAQLFAVKWKMIISAMVVLIAGKLAVMMAAGQMFGVSRIASLRAGETGAATFAKPASLSHGIKATLVCAKHSLGAGWGTADWTDKLWCV
jgi:hypothetical protein